MNDSTEDKIELLIKKKLIKKYYGIDFSSFNKDLFRLRSIVFCENIYIRFWHFEFSKEDLRLIINHYRFKDLSTHETGCCITFDYDFKGCDEDQTTLIEKEYLNIHRRIMDYVSSLDI